MHRRDNGNIFEQQLRRSFVPKGIVESAMTLSGLITLARDQGASDLHLEPGLPAALRVRGSLQTVGEPLKARALEEFAREVIGEPLWADFSQRRSFDLSKTISGVRCRINFCTPPAGLVLPSGCSAPSRQPSKT
jgi:Tfp pilus assembly ATPase PilU